MVTEAKEGKLEKDEHYTDCVHDVTKEKEINKETEAPFMSKNIVLCADGTGNKGGYTPSSNVYKIYNAININENPQIRRYDNGVGMENNKYYRGLSGALGLKRNSVTF